MSYSPMLGRFLETDPAEYVDGPNLYEYVGSNPARFLDPFGLAAEDWRLDLVDHGGPHIQLGDLRWDANTLQPITHKGVTPPKLSAKNLEELRVSGVWDRLRKNVPDNVIRQAAREALGEEIAAELMNRGFKRGCTKKIAREITETILKKLPIVAVVFIGADVAEGGIAYAARNAVVPADLINELVLVGVDHAQAWARQAEENFRRKQLANAGITDEATVRQMLNDIIIQYDCSDCE